MVVLDREHFARTVRGIFLSVGIFLSLVTYAYCQERIMTRPFLVSSSEAMFANTLFLVLVNRTFAVCAAAVVIVSTSGVAGLAPQAPLEKFPVVSVANLVATMCQYEALKWITLATQTLFKCSKLIPMMVLSTVLSRRKYSYVDYASALAVAVGCTVFMKGNITSRIGNKEDSWIGVAFMFGNIAFDSFLTAYQEKLFLGYNLTSNNQMLYVNLFSAVLALLMSLKDDILQPSLVMLLHNHEFRVDLLLLTTGAVSAQFFITCAIKEFGAVFFGTVVTVQQVTSVILSSIVLGSPLTKSQWLSCAAVFGSLTARNLSRLFRRSAPDKAPVVPSGDEVLDRNSSQGGGGGNDSVTGGPSGLYPNARSPKDVRLSIGQIPADAKTV